MFLFTTNVDPHTKWYPNTSSVQLLPLFRRITFFKTYLECDKPPSAYHSELYAAVDTRIAHYIKEDEERAEAAHTIKRRMVKLREELAKMRDEIKQMEEAEDAYDIEQDEFFVPPVEHDPELCLDELAEAINLEDSTATVGVHASTSSDITVFFNDEDFPDLTNIGQKKPQDQPAFMYSP
jgi:hypothetical protein